MNKQFFKGLVTKSENGTYKVLASTSAIDRAGDSIDQSGWDLGNFKKNPVMPWAHDYSALPVAKVTSIEVTDKGLEAEFEFAPAEGNPMAQQIKVLYDEGYLNAVSVGFIPKKRNGNVITEAELLEISFVPVPANQEALRLAMKNFDLSLLPELKGAVSDELTAEEMHEEKCDKFEEVMDVISAFWTVYFDENTPVEDFSKLLTETIALLQVVVDNDGVDPNEMDGEEDGMKSATTKSLIEVTPEIKQKFVDFVSKAGRTLSKNTLDTIDKAIESMKVASTVLEDLKSSSDSVQDGENNADTSKSVINIDPIINEEELKALPAADLNLIRRRLVNKSKDNELALSIVNKFLNSKKEVKN